MAYGKWIFGLMGWVTMGPIGALLGLWLGSAVDNYIERSLQIPDEENPRTGSARAKSYRRNTYSAEEQRNSFLVCLLVLSAAVIKADGKTLEAELNYVKDFVRRNFGEDAVSQAMQMLEKFTRQEVNIYSVGPQIARNMNYSQRLQLFHYLVQIAMADGQFDKKEKSVLEAIAATISLSKADYESVISMFYKETNAAYTVLEVSSTASDDEIRSAYRKMAMKNHPDKVATLGPDVQKAAGEKFRKIQEAYESIKKERGMN